MLMMPDDSDEPTPVSPYDPSEPLWDAETVGEHSNTPRAPKARTDALSALADSQPNDENRENHLAVRQENVPEPYDPNTSFEDKPEVSRYRHRRAQVAAMRNAGLPVEAIAEALSIAPSTVKDYHAKALKEAIFESREEAQALAYRRLEAMLTIEWQRYHNGTEEQQEKGLHRVLALTDRITQLLGAGQRDMPQSQSTTNNTLIIADGDTSSYIEAMKKQLALDDSTHEGSSAVIQAEAV